MPSRLLPALALALPLFAADELTVYELLPPATHQFAIIYDVTAVQAGAKYFFNPVRPGSIVSKEHVVDRATGRDLEWEVVSGKDAKAAGMASQRLADDTQYLKVHLAAPVPENGESRIRILKTYTDAKSYFENGERLVFDRPLGIRRNVVVLPPGWELTGSASPAIVSTRPDGRVELSFYNDRDDQLPVRVTARRIQ